MTLVLCDSCFRPRPKPPGQTSCFCDLILDQTSVRPRFDRGLVKVCFCTDLCTTRYDFPIYRSGSALLRLAHPTPLHTTNPQMRIFWLGEQEHDSYPICTFERTAQGNNPCANRRPSLRNPSVSITPYTHMLMSHAAPNSAILERVFPINTVTLSKECLTSSVHSLHCI